MKKVILFIVFVGIIIGLIFFFTSRPQKQEPLPQPTAIVPITTIAPISAPKKIDLSDANVVFSYEGPTLALPTALPTYLASFSFGLSGSTELLAKEWGLTTAQTNPVPYVFDWIQSDKQLSYNDQAKSISFSFFSTSSNQRTPNITVASLMSTLASSHFFSDSFSLVETNRERLSGVAEGTEELSIPVSVISYQAITKDQPYPFFFSGLTKSAGEVRVQQDGQVLSFSFYVTPALQKEPDRELLSLDSVLAELNNQKGYLSGVNINSSKLYEEASPFTRVNISTISLAYLLIPGESRFVPIYIIEGTGYGTKTQRVRYYLRASS